MQNPCLTCAYRMADKNCETCFNCKKRIEYLQTEFNEGLASGPFLLDSYNKKISEPVDKNEKKFDESVEIHKALYLASKRYKVSIEKICANDHNNTAIYKKILPARIYVTAKLCNILPMTRIAAILNTSDRSIYGYRQKAILNGMLQNKEDKPTQNPDSAFISKTVEQICCKNGYDRQTILKNNKNDPGLRTTRSKICIALHNEPFYMTSVEIANIVGLHTTTVRGYLQEAKYEGIL